MIMSVKKATPGEVLYIYPEELTILVVMAGDDGIRYIEPMNPQFDNNGNVITTYVSYATLSEWTVTLGSITNISATLMGKSHIRI
jgi:hypothetical protein